MKDFGIVFFQLEIKEQDLERTRDWLVRFIAKFDAQWTKIDVGCYAIKMQKDYPLFSEFQNAAREHRCQFCLVEFDTPLVGYFRRAPCAALQKAGVQVRNIAPEETSS
jgi:hypothetical protein